MYTLLLYVHLFLYFTHSLSRFLMTLHLHVQIWCFISLIKCWWARTLREDPEFLPIQFWYSYVSFIHFISWFSLYRIQLLFHFLAICYHVWISICSIAVIMIYYSIFLYLVQVNLGLACIRGVFSSRIYVADSRRVSVFTYFGKRGW